MKVFLNGIAGTGMSSRAGLFSQKGYRVFGSDNTFYPPVDQILARMNATLYSPYAAENIPQDIDFCVVGNIISRGNPEAEYILDNGIQYYSMAEALYKFFIHGKKSVFVAGTHGKPTITSFVSHMLHTAGLEPGFFIGGKPLDFTGNYQEARGDYFVIEGDEYETSFFDRSSKFLKYHPYYLIISALEYDHLHFFPSEDLYLKAFQNLVNQVPSKGLIILNTDYPMNRRAVEKAFTPIKTYGSGEDCDFRLTDIQYLPDHQGYRFTLVSKNQELTFQSKLSGRYNNWNLAAGIILGLHIGIPVETLKHAVAGFNGVERRLRVINHIQNTLFIEDFAHHPTAVLQVLQSLREIYPQKKILVLFEPRSWSLRRNFFQLRLADSFIPADEIYFKEVFQKDKIPPNQALDVQKIKIQLQEKGKRVVVFSEPGEVKTVLSNLDYQQEQVVVVLSNGEFDGIPGFIAQL